MQTSKLKIYAPKARCDFIAAVTRRAAKYGFTVKDTSPMQEEGQLVIIEGQPYPKAVASQRNKLAERIKQQGFQQVMEAAAYTWFNRLAALRFMELHGYLDHSFRVLSPSPLAGRGEWGLPEILEHAQQINLPGLDRDRVVDLKMDGTRDEELYHDLLLAQCHALYQAMPFLFERVDDETELLLPDNLLQTDSLIRELVTAIPEEDWQEVEIIGWLYQFYISEKKDQVIGKVVKSEDIPAATQLFTPNWIVKYMVQNSQGAQWLATYPHSPLKGQMEYYIEPAEQTDEVNAQLAAVTPSTLNPEELTLIDPACGSGHILVEAYELFKAIYLERGYRQRDLAKLILEKNLFGLDIDRRAAQLTGFALMMKGRADDRRLFERGVKLNVMALVDSAGFDAERLAQGVTLDDCRLQTGDLTELKRLFEHATTFGSLIQVPEELAAKLPALKQLSEATSEDLFLSDALKRLGPLVEQAELLAAQYDAVVANPPYMGIKYQSPFLKSFLKSCYDGYEKDVFSAFIARNVLLTKSHGRLGFMTPFVWMFLPSYETLRKTLIDHETISTLVQLQYSGFEGATVPVCTFTLQRGNTSRHIGSYVRLSEFRGSASQGPMTLEAIHHRDCGWFFEAAQQDFHRIPRAPIAYWPSDQFRDVFCDGMALGEIAEPRQGMATTDNDRFLRQWFEPSFDRVGLGCADAEVAAGSGKKWFPYNKGGAFRKWYGNQFFVVNWEDNGRDIKEELKGRNPDVARGESLYFRASLTWTTTSSSYFGVRYSDHGCIFDIKGSSCFCSEDLRFVILGFLASSLTVRLLEILNPTSEFQNGDLKLLPTAKAILEGPVKEAVSQIVMASVAVSRSDWDEYERSWNFETLPILTASSEPTPTLESSYIAWIIQNRDTIAEMKRLEEENNRLFIDAYGLADELTPDVPIEQITLTVNPAYRYGGKLTEEEQWTRFRQDTMKELVSYAIGCIMGRYSLEKPGLILADSGYSLTEYNAKIREWQDILARSSVDINSVMLRQDAKPECFRNGTLLSLDDARIVLARYKEDGLAGRPLIYCKACAEEMKHTLSKNIPISEFDYAKAIRERWFEPETGVEFLNMSGCFSFEPAQGVREMATFTPDEDGIIPLTDTEWFDDDAAHRLIEFILVAWDAGHLEENLSFLANNLLPRKSELSHETLRRYLCDSFFKDHLQAYKKRPIYWLFSSGKEKAIQCLVYLHRYNEGTLARMRMEYVVPLQSKMAARIDKLAEDIQTASTSAQAKRLQKERDKLSRQLEELRRYDEQLRHYADLRISLDLDDGVKVNYGKFGDLLAEVKAVHGKKPEVQ